MVTWIGLRVKFASPAGDIAWTHIVTRRVQNKRVLIWHRELTLCAMLLLLTSGSAAGQATQVTTRALSEVAISVQGRAPATVMAANHSVIAAEINGVTASVAFEVAQEVAAGQLLVQIEDRDYQLQLDLARAAVKAQDARIDQARKRLQRARDLKDRNFASIDELHAKQTDLAVLQADREGLLIAIAQAESTLAKTRVSAPFAGTVVARSAQTGAYVSPGLPLLTLVQTDSAELQGELDPSDVDSLSSSDQMVFLSAGREWPVKFERVSAVVSERSRVQKARLSFTDGTPAIGSTGYLIWQRAQLAVPAQLIVKRGDQLGLFIVENELARFVPLARAEEGRPTEVTLPATSRIIVGGRDRIKDGDRVIVES